MPPQFGASRAYYSRSCYFCPFSQAHRALTAAPPAGKVPAAINQVAELYRAMGDLFKEKYYQMAVDTYQFLLRDYPANRYREDAMLAIAQIEKDDLRDAVLAKKSYEEFLTLHPRSPHATEVRAILDQLRGDSASAGSASKLSAARDRSSPNSPDRSTPRPTVTEKSPAATAIKEEASTDSGTTSGARPRVTRIRAWNADTYT